MALNEAALRDPASQKQTPSDNPAGDKPDGHVAGEIAASNLGGGAALSPEVSSVITDELLRERIRALTGEKPEPHRLKRLLNHSLFAILVSFILAVPVGGFLTYLYARWQQEEASRRSFSDELNKVRVQKIGEVWEQLDKNEVTLDDLLKKSNSTPGSNKELFDKIETLIDENRVVVNKNRFWLGKQCYDKINNYLSATRPIVADMLVGPPGVDVGELRAKREQAKQDIERIRNMFLTGEQEPCK